MIGEYNTQREGIILKEYGRNVQKLVNYIRTIPDKEKRTKMATTLIELIKQLAPVVKEPHENPQRMWDDLYIIADFNLDIDNPFTTPDRTILFKKPRKMEYPQSEVRFKHYGKNVERLIKEAIKKEDPQEREEASVIVKDLKNLSQGKLVLDLEKVREENLFEKLYRERKNPRPNDNRDNREGGRDNSNRNRNPRFNKNRRGNNPHRRRDQ